MTRGIAMRRGCSFLGLTLLLVACGGGGSSSPTANAAATTTRSAEQTQVSGVLTPAASGSVVARGTVSVGSPSSGILIPPPQGTRPPTVSVGSAPVGTAPAAPSSAATQVVKVTATDGAFLRDKPDTSGQVVATLDYGTEAPVLESNVPGADGTSKWFRVSFAGKTGFIRNDVVSGPQAPSPPQPPTPVATATAKP
ncbi:MAG: SH3 domain-containing protein [Thermomicrobiales bacterium]